MNPMNFYGFVKMAAEAEEGGEHSAFTIAPKELFRIGGVFPVTETMISGLLTVLIIAVFFVCIRIFFIPRWEKEPFIKSRFRILIEKGVSLFDRTAKEQTHQYANTISSLYIGLAAYIAIGTLIEMLGFRPSTTDFNLTIGLGLITFTLITVLGFKKKRVKSLLKVPLNATIPISMGIRLFANMFSGFVVMHLLYSAPFPMVYPIIGNILLTFFHAAVQAYVFMFLSMSLINEAIE